MGPVQFFHRALARGGLSSNTGTVCHFTSKLSPFPGYFNIWVATELS